MRLLFIISSIILLLGSCAHNRIRLVKVNKPTVINAERAESNVQSNSEKLETGEEPSLYTSGTTEPEYFASTEDAVEHDLQSPVALRAPEDSTGSESKIDAHAINEALDAEDDAKAAKRLFAGALITMWIPIISIASIILFIIGWIKLDKANRSRYITKEGERHSWVATILRNIYMVLIMLLVLLVILLVILFW